LLRICLPITLANWTSGHSTTWVGWSSRDGRGFSAKGISSIALELDRAVQSPISSMSKFVADKSGVEFAKACLALFS
jgi:hypothetical protein